MSFLPDNYKAPSAKDGYMKLQEGENKIRILSKPIIGWEDWDDKKPVRFRMDNKPKAPIDPKKQVRHFWAMIVWNCKEEMIQILQITQASIRERIQCLAQDPDWGAPFGYDLKIVKSGEGMKTEYNVNPSPHKPISQDIIDAFNAQPCYLDALFDNQDPYAEWDCITPGEFGVTQQPLVVKQDKKAPQKMIDNLKALLDKNPKYKQEFYDIIDGQRIILADMPSSWVTEQMIKAKAENDKLGV